MKAAASRYKVDDSALSAIRRLAGKTQVELAAAAGVNHSYISRLERGLRLGCAREVLEALARELQVPTSALIAAKVDE